MQSLLLLHIVPQAEPTQTYGLQALEAVAGQPPALTPSQNRPGVSVLPTHVAAAHCTDTDCAWHPPTPLHRSPVHDAAFAAHSFFGSVLADAGVQAVPALLTTWHTGHDATDAQRSSFCAWAQVPVWHWLAPVQTVPAGPCAWHTLPLHQLPDAHWASVVQPVAHAVPVEHRYGAHEVFAVPVQLPPAPHSGPLRVPAVQLTAPQGVFTGALQVPAPSHAPSLQAAMFAEHSFFKSVVADAKAQAVPALLMTWHTGHDATAPQRRPLCA